MIDKFTALEKLYVQCEQKGINIEEKWYPRSVKALYFDSKETEPVITLNRSFSDQENVGILAEEIGHYHTSYGDILTDKSVDKVVVRQQELRARRWAIKHLVSMKKIVNAYDAGCRNFFEMAEYVGVDQEFLVKSFSTYTCIYGKYKIYGNYIIYFDPPGIFKLI